MVQYPVTWKICGLIYPKHNSYYFITMSQTERYDDKEKLFKECERTINLILQKLMIYIESKDNCDVIRSIEKMKSNLALLTKAYK